jgi:hypothetical protein
LFGVLRSVLAVVGVVTRIVIKVKIDIKNGWRNHPIHARYLSKKC